MQSWKVSQFIRWEWWHLSVTRSEKLTLTETLWAPSPVDSPNLGVLINRVYFFVPSISLELDKVVITNDADVRALISAVDKLAFLMPIILYPRDGSAQGRIHLESPRLRKEACGVAQTCSCFVDLFWLGGFGWKIWFKDLLNSFYSKISLDNNKDVCQGKRTLIHTAEP